MSATKNTGYNDLATTNPELLSEWNYKKNSALGLEPTAISSGSGKKAWWKCEKGHEWQTKIKLRKGKKGTGCPYCTGQKAITGETDLATTNPELLSKWNYEKNSALGLEPTDFSSGSGKKVWWKCNKGHTWEAKIAYINRGKGCPYCSGKYVIQGETDLATTNPELLKEWDYERNNKIELKPNEISAGSNRKAFWICSKGHTWEASIMNRTKGSNCPVCFKMDRQLYGVRKRNTLANEFPELLNEWDIENNKKLNLDANTLTSGSGKKAWWKCNKGHKWKATIKQRTKGFGCPYCSGREAITGKTDLATTHPELLKEWDYKKNNAIGVSPENITAGSDKKVFWKCSKGHEWETVIQSRTRKNNCPYCSGVLAITGKTDLATTHPDLLKEWDYERNDELKIYPTDYSAGSGKKVFWKCGQGHKWKATIHNRTFGHGCPYCSKKKTSY